MRCPDVQYFNLGITWAYTIAIIFTAFVGKFGGCALAAKYVAGFNWREAGAIGSLMSCKGYINIFSFLSFALMVFIGLWSLSFSTLAFLLVFYPK
jgi:Kef-type K+ transport system membrane component KefB